MASEVRPINRNSHVHVLSRPAMTVIVSHLVIG